jgi:hypothetical protein
MGLRHYCTYFDHRYLPQGLALYNSMRQHIGDFHLSVLALDERCATVLRGLRLKDVEIINLGELEKADPEFQKSRLNRSLVEFYFTSTSCFLHHLLKTRNEIDRLTYIDADTYFFADPGVIEREAEKSSIVITPHRFRPELTLSHLKFGAYNVGWLSFKQDQAGLACLAHWRKQCLEWCKDEPEEGRFGDQGYLDEWPKLYPSTLVLDRPGFNEAPWNIRPDNISRKDGHVFIDHWPLVLFHFQGLQRISRRIFNPRFENYRLKPERALTRLIYRPYLSSLIRAERENALEFALQDSIRDNAPGVRPESSKRIFSKLTLLKKILRKDYLVARS